MEALVVHLDLTQSALAAVERLGIEDPGDDPRVVHVLEGLEVGVMPEGTAGGRPSVMLAVPLPDGRLVIAETTLALYLNSAVAFRGRYGGVDEELLP